MSQEIRLKGISLRTQIRFLQANLEELYFIAACIASCFALLQGGLTEDEGAVFRKAADQIRVLCTTQLPSAHDRRRKAAAD